MIIFHPNGTFVLDESIGNIKTLYSKTSQRLLHSSTLVKIILILMHFIRLNPLQCIAYLILNPICNYSK